MHTICTPALALSKEVLAAANSASKKKGILLLQAKFQGLVGGMLSLKKMNVVGGRGPWNQGFVGKCYTTIKRGENAADRKNPLCRFGTKLCLIWNLPAQE